jgi:hypothetical protein
VSGADQRDVHVVSGVHMPRFADAGWYDSTTLIIRSKAAAAIGHAANTRCRKVAPRQANGGILLGPFGVVSHMLVGGMRVFSSSNLPTRRRRCIAYRYDSTSTGAEA